MPVDLETGERLLADKVGQAAAKAVREFIEAQSLGDAAEAARRMATTLLEVRGIDVPDEPSDDDKARRVAQAKPTLAQFTTTTAGSSAEAAGDVAPAAPPVAAANRQSKRSWLSKRERAWLAELCQSEGGLLTITQGLAEKLMALPHSHLAAYLYLRALACNADHPGVCYISHAVLGKKIRRSESQAERITAALRGAGLIQLARRGAALYKTANVYRVVAFTPETLAKAKAYYGGTDTAASTEPAETPAELAKVSA